jgi:UDP-3-O-[3-hydroxymyristoyl] N-acetylglucosamine deacetylase
MKLQGVGLHSGERCTVYLHQAEGPLHFRVGNESLKPLASNVVDTSRCTVLGLLGSAVRLMTIEHLLAALYIKGIWENLLLEVEGPEIPILDGSAQPWLEALSGFGSQGPQAVALPHPLRVQLGGSYATATPAPDWGCSVSIEFPHPQIGLQQVSCPPTLLQDLASARTFGFLHEVEALKAQGLIKGASLENALVFDGEKSLNAARMPAEPAWHKALDFLGDLYLAGRPYLGHFQIHKGSHRLHVELARSLQTMSTH